MINFGEEVIYIGLAFVFYFEDMVFGQYREVGRNMLCILQNVMEGFNVFIIFQSILNNVLLKN